MHVGDTIAYQTPIAVEVKKLRDPIPLVCLATQHASASYEWTKVGTLDTFPSTAIVFIREVGLYKCSVTCRDKRADSLVMSVELRPGKSSLLRRNGYCL